MYDPLIYISSIGKTYGYVSVVLIDFDDTDSLYSICSTNSDIVGVRIY